MKDSIHRKPRKRTKPTLQRESQRLHLSVFVSDEEHMLLREQSLDELKAALLYADQTDFYCAEAQFTFFVRDLLDAPTELLYNLARGHELGDSRLSRHGKAGPYAIQRILADHLPGLQSTTHSQAIREIDALKSRLLTEGGEDAEGQKVLESLGRAISTGRVQLKDWVRTDKAPDAPYTIDYLTPLDDALSRSNTAVLCNTAAATHVRKDARVNYPARERAADAALGTGFIAKLPAFPDATMDEILSLERDADATLRRYRAEMISFREKMNNTSPFDLDFKEYLQNLWSSEVLPTISDLEERYQETGWFRYIWDRREKIMFPALGVLAISVAPHLAFLDPEVQALLSEQGPLLTSLGAYATVNPILGSLTDVRLTRHQVERNSLFYLTGLNSRLAR